MEYFTRGIVIARDFKNDTDDAVLLYTKDFGKIRAFVKNIKNITSKLSGHLQVGALCDMRMARKGNIQLIEVFAVKSGLTSDLHKFLEFIDNMLPYESKDLHIWHAVEYVIENNVFTSDDEELKGRVYRRFLEIMGFGARFAKCSNCGSDKIAYFYPSDIMFLCSNSFNKSGMENYEVIKI